MEIINIGRTLLPVGDQSPGSVGAVISGYDGSLLTRFHLISTVTTHNRMDLSSASMTHEKTKPFNVYVTNLKS